MEALLLQRSKLQSLAEQDTVFLCMHDTTPSAPNQERCSEGSIVSTPGIPEQL